MTNESFPNATTTTREPTPPIIKYEVKKAAILLKIGKASGPYNIDDTFLKMFQKSRMVPMIKLFNKMINSERIPTQ